jgi:hypothetical protein
MITHKDALGPLPAVHPRDSVVTEASNELLGFMVHLTRRYELTRAEEYQILAEYMRTVSQMAVNMERERKRAKGSPR